TTKNEEKAFELYSKAAEAGDLDAQYALALCYEYGLGTTKNVEKAFGLYSKAAEAGNIAAQTNLGFCYANGKGTKRNEEKALNSIQKQQRREIQMHNTILRFEKAFELYSKAAEAGDLDAQYALALCYEYGLGTTKNVEKAFGLYSKAAEAGNTNTQYNLALCYANGKGTKRNEEKAFELYSIAAEAGDLDAQYAIARSAEAGNIAAQTNLGFCYANGKGTKRNEEKAFGLYSKAAEAGNTNAQYNLALSAEAGDEDAQYAIGRCYKNGEGTTKNEEKAFEFYSKPIEAGSLVAQLRFEHYYLNGNPSRQNNLETTHRNGWGTTKNL
ncbi:hypothetical protein G9A89_007493, partial [Geosiphon pyriformis]